MLARVIFLSFVLASGTALAQDYTDGVSGAEAESLVLEAMRAAGIRDGSPMGSIRPFPACDTTPTVAPRGGDWGTAVIRCGDEWSRSMRTRTTYAPQRPAAPSRAAETTGAMVVVLKRNMESGQMISEEDVMLAPNGSRSSPETFSRLEDVIGRRLKSRVTAEQMVFMRHLETDWLIVQGQPVVLKINANGIEVSASGEALEAGELGDIIRVKNLQSQKVIKAIVDGKNSVSIRPNIG